MAIVLGNACKSVEYLICFVEWCTLRKVRIHKVIIQKGADTLSEAGEGRISRSSDVVALCLDSYSVKRQDGRLHHQYMVELVCFTSLIKALGQSICFRLPASTAYAEGGGSSDPGIRIVPGSERLEGQRK